MYLNVYNIKFLIKLILIIIDVMSMYSRTIIVLLNKDLLRK